MAVLTAARFITITDALTAAFLLAKTGLGDSTVEEPQTDAGIRGRLGTLENAVLVYQEDDYNNFLVGLRGSIDKANYQAQVAGIFGKALTSLDALCAASGLTGVAGYESFATYYNKGVGGPWNAWLAPDWRDLQNLVAGAFPSPWNVYSPAIANMAARTRTASVDAALVPGTDVDSTKYAGAARLQIAVTDFAGAAGIVQVIGNGRDATGAAITGHTWSVNVTADGTYTLAAAVTGDICTHVSGITFPAAITGGTVQVAAAIPAGRTNPPS